MHQAQTVMDEGPRQACCSQPSPDPLPFIPYPFLSQLPLTPCKITFPSHALCFQILLSWVAASVSGWRLHCYYDHILSLMCPQGILHTHKNQAL